MSGSSKAYLEVLEMLLVELLYRTSPQVIMWEPISALSLILLRPEQGSMYPLACWGVLYKYLKSRRGSLWSALLFKVK
jgi:hypothetical protein